ncbi:hypothetical protein G5B37_00415 [Rasiella rasia]|uniref:YdhG-like domain-containing protein n=1 Tax=Rasiella rasia TaxID=2744027 RepID=A0A6G6GHQ8_9FLAO|nr:DUF1801 domain-containing protein [Rasiella rasia]QIE58082.1 hypothetical protein G5B37_00415 [Rasiella rasia]
MERDIETFFAQDSTWQQEYVLLRNIVLATNLKEEFKWGKPCYTYKNRNVVLIHGFKEYCALLFHKGVLLKDSDKLLVQQTKNVQAARQLRFKNIKEISDQEKLITTYLFEAVEVEKAGLKVPMKKTTEYEVPNELVAAFSNNLALEKAFKALTPGRQRGYLLYFSAAKQAKTRELRIEKSIERIFEGKGPNDR